MSHYVKHISPNRWEAWSEVTGRLLGTFETSLAASVAHHLDSDRRREADSLKWMRRLVADNALHDENRRFYTLEEFDETVTKVKAFLKIP